MIADDPGYGIGDLFTVLFIRVEHLPDFIFADDFPGTISAYFLCSSIPHEDGPFIGKNAQPDLCIGNDTFMELAQTQQRFLRPFPVCNVTGDVDAAEQLPILVPQRCAGDQEMATKAFLVNFHRVFLLVFY